MTADEFHKGVVWLSQVAAWKREQIAEEMDVSVFTVKRWSEGVGRSPSKKRQDKLEHLLEKALAEIALAKPMAIPPERFAVVATTDKRPGLDARERIWRLFVGALCARRPSSSDASMEPRWGPSAVLLLPVAPRGEPEKQAHLLVAECAANVAVAVVLYDQRLSFAELMQHAKDLVEQWLANPCRAA